MNKIFKMNLTQEEMNVIRNGLGLALSKDDLGDNAIGWYKKVKARFDTEYIKQFITDNEENTDTDTDIKYSKPPLGITPKYIFELQRVQELCRALYEYSHYENSIDNYEYMRKWADELLGRLNELKFDMENEE